MFQCPNCGGQMYFNIPGQQLKCEYCESMILVPEYRLKNQAEDHVFEEMHLFACKNCGAELLSPDESLVTFCSYCGSEAVMQGRADTEQTQTIIPFQVSKDQCKERYLKRMKRFAFLPKELKDPEAIDRFRGVYIPYQEYSVGYDQAYTFDVTQRKSSGSYTYIHKGKASFSAKGTVYDRAYDMSSAFDDNIAAKVGKYEAAGEVPYDPGYLAGFYADRTDIDEAEYDEIAVKNADAAVLKNLKSYLASNSMTLNGGVQENELFKGQLTAKKKKLYPVWFLTWRRKNRVAYSIMNGQTGEMASDLPVNVTSFLLTTAVTALVLFALLTAFFSTTAIKGLSVCMLLSCIAMLVFRNEIKKLMLSENHVFDFGYDGPPVKMPEKKLLKLRKAAGTTSGCAALLIVLLVIGTAAALLLQSSALLSVLVCPIVALILFISVIADARYLEEKTEALAVFWPLLSVFYSGVISFLIPASDLWFYAGSLLCMLSSLILCLTLIRIYNRLSTRPIPSFFDRKGGRDHAED